MLKLLVILSAIYFIHASETPIIGILSQETYIVAKYFPGENFDSFIAASYVKYLESAGARVVPIWIGKTKDYYENVVNYTNGILFPGGGTYFNETGGYGEAASYIFKAAVEANNRGVYYPLFGICMGLQVLAFAETEVDIRIDCSLKKVAVPLQFVEGYESSRLFSKAPKEVLQTLESENVTYNQHRYCLTEDILKKNGLLEKWKILSINKDKLNVEFVSSMEHKMYPFYGVQFHPEKNAFEFKRNVGIPHSSRGVRASQYFANFFVDESRKNKNAFPNYDIEARSLIYNFNPKYTGINNASYEQIYVFKYESK